MKVLPVKNIDNRITYSSHEDYLPKRKRKVSPEFIMAGALVSALAVYKIAHPVQKYCSTYVKSLCQSVNEMTNRKMEPFSLSTVMDKSEFVENILKLNKQNYNYTDLNIKNFGFSADFHLHTEHSDGKISVPNLLNEISEYSDKLFKRTGKKFMFSITDHDSVEGVKEALNIISQNPQKFKNVKFIPGIEISFAHEAPKSSNPCEVSELLAYGFNPFKIDNYLKNLQSKRNAVIDNMLSEIQKALPLTKFDKNEFIKIYDINPNCILMNSHWSVFEYAQTKHALTIQASRKGVDAAKFYEDTMKNIDVKNKNIWYLKKNNFLDIDINETDVISNVRKKYEPHFENNTLKLTNENSFEDVINLFKNDRNVVLSFAHPYFTAEKFHQPNKILNNFVHQSNGLIQLSEAFHQAYPKDVNLDKIEQTNNYLRHLIQIGGSDNHKSTYIEVNV